MVKNRHNRGMALYLVLGILFLTIMVAQIFFSVVLNQAALSYHQISRTQAFYAAKLGMIYAIDRLSNGSDAQWKDSNTFTRYICHDSSTAPCTDAVAGPLNYTTENALPASISFIKITVFPEDVATGLRKINVTANFTSGS